MRRLPALAFAALVVATVGAFFVTQHLKSSTPLYAGFPRPKPQWINPRSGAACDGVSHRATTVSFYLLHRADDVDVYIVNSAGAIVRTVASGRHMRIRVRRPDGVFHWDGRDRQRGCRAGRRVPLPGRAPPAGAHRPARATVYVETVAPHPRVTNVSPALIPQDGSPVRVHYRGNERRAGTLLIYRTDLPGAPKLVDSSPTDPHVPTTWNGTVRGRPAPAGTYLIGLQITDSACNVGRFPATLPPAPGSTPHAGVTVRYLAAQPPMAPVTAGSRALIFVDSRQRPYTLDADSRWDAQAGVPRHRSRRRAPCPFAAIARRRAVRAGAPVRGTSHRRAARRARREHPDRTCSSSSRR